MCVCARVHAHLRNVVFWRWTETRIYYFEWEFDKNLTWILASNQLKNASEVDDYFKKRMLRKN